MSTRPRIALVGPGRWGANVLRDLKALECDVWAVARSAASVARARERGADGIVGAIDDLPSVDGAVVCTPETTHHDVIEALRAAQDVPVFVEKPLTADPDQADALAARHAGRLFVMDKWRYHPGVAALAAIARTGELGAVQGVHSRRVTLGHRYRDVDTVWVHLPHDLSIVLEILGELPAARHAVEERVGGERVGLHAVLGAAPWVAVEVSCVAPGHRRELRLVCEGGVAQLDGGWAEEVHVLRDVADDPVPEVRPLTGELPLLAELRAFVGHLAGGPPPRTSAEDGALVVRRIAELGELARAQAVPA
jgi:predicted dehydrogenase